MHAARRRLYLGRYTTAAGDAPGRDRLEPEHGLILGELGPHGGAIAPVGGVTVPDASYNALHPSGSTVYSVVERAEGAVEAAHLDAATGAVTPLGRVSSGGAEPCHVSVHPSGRFVFTANYGSGSVAVHRVEADGSLGELCALVEHQGSGPVPDRQNGPHAHQAVPHPSGETLLAVDLGTDCVYAYRVDERSGDLRLLTHSRIADGAGPRHLALHPSGTVFYLANELNSTICACDYDPASGTVTVRQTVDAAPLDESRPNYPGGIAVAPGGHAVYWTNRGDQSIAAYRLDHGCSLLDPVGRWDCGGDWPRDLAFTPDGGRLLVANQRSGDVTVFGVRHGSGTVQRLGSLAVDRASSVLVV